MSRRVLLVVALLLPAALPVSAQTVSLTLRDGRVTLVTQNATPAAILAEWARQGQVKVIDGEKVPATSLTLHIENATEREALDIVLRGAAGYIAAPRTSVAAANLSRFDRVIVMPSSPGAGTAARASAAAAMRPAPVAAAPVVQQAPDEEVAQAPVAVDDGSGTAGGAEQPASATSFDYANPQRYFAARQAEQAAATAQQQQQQTQTASQPSTSPMGMFGQTSARPGVLPAPQPQPGTVPAATSGNGATLNPYGLPAGQAPGSAAVPSQLEPDRAKYINPYAPTPPTP